MDKYKELAEALKAHSREPVNNMMYAEVKSVEGDTCTITYAGIDIADVRLKATGAGGDDKLIIAPKAGTMALVGSLSGKLTDLVVLKVDEPEVISYTFGGLEVIIDSTDKKVSIKNDQVSLLDLMSSLKSIIEQLTVATPAGPSGTPLPPTITALAQFEMDFNNLLK